MAEIPGERERLVAGLTNMISDVMDGASPERRREMAKGVIDAMVPFISELPPPGPSNIVVRTPNPLKAPERVEDQG